jgi:hypothetical protein
MNATCETKNYEIEYLWTRESRDKTLKDIEKLMGSGWELFSINETSSGTIYWFKRWTGFFQRYNPDSKFDDDLEKEVN